MPNLYPCPVTAFWFRAATALAASYFRSRNRRTTPWLPRCSGKPPRLKAKFTNLVFLDGYVYGLDDGVLTCLDPTNGERRWKDGRYGHGQVILVANLLLVQTEEGEIVLVDPNPQALRELARFVALEGKTWNPPALAGSSLLVRNDREAACYELPLIQ